MADLELDWNEAISVAQLFMEERFRKLLQGDREALLGCYRPNSVISWKGHLVNQDSVVGYYTSLRNKTIELISIDAQPVPDDPNGSWSNQVMVIATLVISPDVPEESQPCPSLATHTFFLSPDLTSTGNTPVLYISHHIYR